MYLTDVYLFQGEDLINYLRTQLKCKEKELFVIIPSSIDRSQAWQLPEAEGEGSSNGSMRVVLPRSHSAQDANPPVRNNASDQTEDSRVQGNGGAKEGVGDAKSGPATKTHSVVR